MLVASAMACLWTSGDALANRQGKATVTQIAKTTPALWRVAGKGKGHAQFVYLFGSIHIGNKAMFPMPSYVLMPFYQSRYLAVELNTTKVTRKIQQTIRNNTLLARGDSLKKWLSAPTYTALMAHARRTKMKGFKPKQPWFVASQISLERAGSLGFTPAYGVDVHLINLAKERKKPVLAMETWEDQLGVFAGMTRKEQDRYLMETLKSHGVARNSDPTLKLMWAWQNGHEKELWRQVTTEMTRINNPTFMSRMLYDRNDRMVKTLKPWLVQPYSTFVVVGSAHLLGHKGLLKQLYDQGYRVERINPKTRRWYNYFPRGKVQKRARAARR